MKKAVIFLNGDRTDISAVKQYIDDKTLIIGVDGGTNHILKLGLKPNVVIGDFDSFEEPKNVTARERSDRGNLVEYIRYPRDKDFTDGELAIEYAIKKGCKEITVFGLLGSRVDHVLGNILLLLKKEYAETSIKIIEGNQEIYIIRNDAVIHGKKGDTISFMPIDGVVQSTKTSGLKYPLENYQLSIQGNRGISNLLTKDTAAITLKKVVLLVIHQRDTKC